MTPAEQITLRRFREETASEFAAVRSEFRDAMTQQRLDFAPALEFYDRVNTIGHGLQSVGRFMKWGAGIGASVVIIIGGLHGLGIV